MNLFVEQKEIESQTLKTYDCQRGALKTYNCQRGQGRKGLEGWTGVWDWHVHTEVYGMIGQWELAL